MENELGISEYRCVKDGGDFPIYECLECGEDQLVYDADNEKYHCFSCEKNYTTEDLTFCERCGSIMERKNEAAVCQNCLDDLSKE